MTLCYCQRFCDSLLNEGIKRNNVMRKRWNFQCKKNFKGLPQWNINSLHLGFVKW